MNPQLTCSQRQWLHSSVGRASHRYREVTGSNPVKVQNFFQASLRNCINCVTGSNPVEVQNFFQASLRNCINCVHCDDHFFIFTLSIYPVPGIEPVDVPTLQSSALEPLD